jgi:hypothetical protein
VPKLENITAASSELIGMSNTTHGEAGFDSRIENVIRLLNLNTVAKQRGLEIEMSLKQRLYDEYKGFSDKRIKRLDKSDLFRVDDRQPRHFGADRKLFYWFGEIYVTTLDDYSVQVELIGGVPISSEITNLLTGWNAEVNHSPATGRVDHVTFRVDKRSTDRLETLAAALKAIVAPGRRYPVEFKWYKHTCPQIAESLLRLKSVLDGYWTNPPAHRPLEMGRIF